MANFDAVIFDWMLTLAHYPSNAEHIETAMKKLGRAADTQTVDRIVGGMERAAKLPEVRAAGHRADTSAEAHAAYERLIYDRAGIDRVLADEMYGLLGDPEFHLPYPDAVPVLERLHGAGVKVAVVSDIHVDLRPHAEQFGFGPFIDVWVLSFELGIQKPDLDIFGAAIDRLGIRPHKTLMVGDRAALDGAASELGLTCLILPPMPRFDRRGLDAVCRLAIDST